MWFSFPWRGFVFSFPWVDLMSCKVRNVRDAIPKAIGFYLVRAAWEPVRVFVGNFQLKVLCGKETLGKCQQKKGEGCDPVIRFVGPGSSHKFGEIAIFSAIYRGPMSLHLWLDPGPTLSLISENLKIECEDGFPCSSRMGNDGSWRDGVFQKSSPTSETWLFQICETFENWYMIMEKRYLKMYFPLRMERVRTPGW